MGDSVKSGRVRIDPYCIPDKLKRQFISLFLLQRHDSGHRAGELAGLKTVDKVLLTFVCVGLSKFLGEAPVQIFLETYFF